MDPSEGDDDDFKKMEKSLNSLKLQREEFALHRMPQREGNMNGWLNEDEDEPLGYEAFEKEVESSLESTARMTANVNNVNGGNGNGGNNRCSYKTFTACNPKEFDGKDGAVALTRWIENIESVFDNSGCTANKRVKVLLMEEFCPSNKIEKLEYEFWNQKMVGANHAGYTDRFHELSKLVLHLVTPESSGIKRARILTDEEVSCGTLTKGNEKRKGVEESRKQGGKRNNDKRAKVAPINAVRGEHEPGTCYEYGSHEHFQNTYPKLNLAPVSALQDPNIVMGTFSLNNHYATVLFNSEADFSFISTDFAPLLNLKLSFVNPGYVIEVADVKKVEVDRIIRDCKLELGTSLFTIDLIPLGHGSFDVIVGMDWLSKHKAEIVCHEKVVRIPLESGEIHHVQGERTPGIAKALSNVKVDELQLSDISVVQDFVEVFPEDLSRLPPQ
ncbi:putative reverse transcriptase domain-containing protein [Tanacetum coccineum]